jgi:hypothetical protein
MSGALIRDLVVVQTRGLKLPGIARTFEVNRTEIVGERVV